MTTDVAVDAPGGRASGLRTIVQRLGWGVADQAVSSMSNFALSYYVSTAFGGAEFGAFSLAFVTYTVVLNASRGLSTDPLLVRYSGVAVPIWRRASSASSGMALVVGLLAGVVCVLAGLALPGDLGDVFLGLGIFLPGMLLQDSWRFALFAAGRGAAALAVDVVWSALLVVAIVGLHHEDVAVGWMMVATGATASVAALVGILLAGVVPSPRAASAWLAENRQLSWRYLLENVSFAGASQLRAFALGAVAGLAAVGWLRTADMLMGPFLVILMGIAQVAVPEASRALRRSLSTMFRFCLLMAGAQAVAATLWALAAAAAFPLLIRDRLSPDSLQTWSGGYQLLLPTALTYIAMSFATAAAAGIRAMGMARFSLRAQLSAAALFLIAGVAGAIIGGVQGTAWAGLGATLAGVGIWWWSLRAAGAAWQRQAGASQARDDQAISAGFASGAQPDHGIDPSTGIHRSPESVIPESEIGRIVHTEHVETPIPASEGRLDGVGATPGEGVQQGAKPDSSGGAYGGGPGRRTLGRIGIQLVHLVSSLVGDDWFGRTVRQGVLRLSGAQLGQGVALHGGTFISWPRHLVVGEGSFINRNCYLDLEGSLTLGRGVTVGHGTTFITSVHALGPRERRCGPFHGRCIEVGDGAWLGANVTVMPGVRIGSGAVIAAGAVVTADIPPDVVAVGVPARVVRTLDADGEGDSDAPSFGDQVGLAPGARGLAEGDKGESAISDGVNKRSVGNVDPQLELANHGSAAISREPGGNVETSQGT